MIRTFVGNNDKLKTGKNYKLSVVRGNGEVTAFIEVDSNEPYIIKYNSLVELSKDWKFAIIGDAKLQRKKKRRRNHENA